MKRVILHIGQSKTGTTSLQRFLYSSSDWLHARGYHYLRTGIRALRVPAQYGLLHDNMGLPTILPRDLTGTAAARDEIWRAALAEIDGTSASGFLLSCESAWLMDKDSIAFVRAQLSDFPVQILLVLRDPCAYIVSSYKQHLKVGSFGGSFREFVDKRGPLLDYPALIGQWGDAFGQDNLTVLSYEEIRGELLSACLRAMGIANDRDAMTAAANNASNVTPADGVLIALRYLHALERRAPALRRGLRRLRRQILTEPPSVLARLLNRLPLRVLTEADYGYAAQALAAQRQRYTDFDRPLKAPSISSRMPTTHTVAWKDPTR